MINHSTSLNNIKSNSILHLFQTMLIFSKQVWPLTVNIGLLTNDHEMIFDWSVMILTVKMSTGTEKYKWNPTAFSFLSQVPRHKVVQYNICHNKNTWSMEQSLKEKKLNLESWKMSDFFVVVYSIVISTVGVRLWRLSVAGMNQHSLMVTKKPWHPECVTP